MNEDEANQIFAFAIDHGECLLDNDEIMPRENLP